MSGVALRAPYQEEESTFACSDERLNRVWEFCRYSIEATTLDLFQDTPTREHGPYEGDAYINQLSLYGVQRSYAVARYSNKYLARRPTWPTEYRLMSVLCAWNDYLYTGDEGALRGEYELFVEKQLDEHYNSDGLVEKNTGGDLVDWPSSNRDGYVFTRINTVINAFQYAASRALSQVATARQAWRRPTLQRAGGAAAAGHEREDLGSRGPRISRRGGH